MKRSNIVNWGSAFETIRRRFGRLPAVVSEEGTYSFDEVLRHAAAVAESLLAQGVQPGEPVAIFLPNRPHAVWASIGVVLSGAAETSLNFGLTAEELKYCLDLLKVRIVISDARLAPVVKSCGHTPLLIETLAAEPAELAVDRPVAGDRWGKILFTSGTTARPKAIVHSHERRWLASLMLRASLPFMPRPGTRILLMTPYSHGSSLLAGAFMESGGSIYLMEGPQTDLIGGLLASGSIDCMFAPPTVLAKLVASLDTIKGATLRTIFTGTSTLSPALYRRTRDIFGPVVRITYGKTEIFNPITVLEPDEVDRAYAADGAEAANLGAPVSGVEIEIRDDAGAVVPAGSPGRIFIRAPHMLVAYVDERGAHEAQQDEWHESGDIGFMSDRNDLFIVGREHDVIKTGGYKLFPQEIEAPLASARIASDVAVVGVPSQYWGQIVVAVAENPSSDWIDRAKQAVACLSKHKHPRAYVSLPEFPRNAQGKLQRNKVLEAILSRYQVEDGPRPGLTAKK